MEKIQRDRGDRDTESKRPGQSDPAGRSNNQCF